MTIGYPASGRDANDLDPPSESAPGAKAIDPDDLADDQVVIWEAGYQRGQEMMAQQLSQWLRGFESDEGPPVPPNPFVSIGPENVVVSVKNRFARWRRERRNRQPEVVQKRSGRAPGGNPPPPPRTQVEPPPPPPEPTRPNVGVSERHGAGSPDASTGGN